MIELPDNALVFEPREFLDAAIIGTTTGPSNRPVVAVYDRDLLIQALAASFLADAARDGEDPEDYDDAVLEQDAEEWLSTNTEGSDVGPHTPIVVQQGSAS